MKFSTMMTVLAVALCVAGCKYDKAGKGGKGAGNGDDANSIDISASQSGSIGDASEGKFEDMYAKCTDVDFEPV